MLVIGIQVHVEWQTLYHLTHLSSSQSLSFFIGIFVMLEVMKRTRLFWWQTERRVFQNVTCWSCLEGKGWWCQCTSQGVSGPFRWCSVCTWSKVNGGFFRDSCWLSGRQKGGSVGKCVNITYKSFGGGRFCLLPTRCREDSTITVILYSWRNRNLWVCDAEIILVTDGGGNLKAVKVKGDFVVYGSFFEHFTFPPLLSLKCFSRIIFSYLLWSFFFSQP